LTLSNKMPPLLRTSTYSGMKKKLLLSLASLTIIGGAIVWGSGYAVIPLANQIIRQNGFPEARISGLTMTPNGAMIQHIALDRNDFSTIDNINIGFDWIDFLKTGQIQSLDIKDISLTCELDEKNQFKIAGWDATLPHSSSQGALLPLHSLLLQGVTLDVETSQGNIRIEGKLSVDTTANEKQTLHYAIWGQQHQLSFDAQGSGEILKDGPLSLSTTINDGRVNFPNLEISRAAGQFNFYKTTPRSIPKYSGKFLAGKVNTMGALLQNVTLDLDTTKADSLYFKTSPAGHKNINFTGKWVIQPTNQLEFTVNSADTMEFLKLVHPESEDDLKPWLSHANPLTLSIIAPIQTLQGADKNMSYTILFGDKKSAITFLSSGAATYSTETGTADISAAKTIFSIGDGTISISPFKISSPVNQDTPLQADLTFTNVNMEKLATISNIDGLTAKGVLNGIIPITYSKKDGVVFGKGNLQSVGDGLFSYRPSSFPGALRGDDTRMKTVRQALSDFHFTHFSATVSGPFSGKMKTTISAEGLNPIFGDRPIKLNLNLDGDLGNVIEQTLQAGGIGRRVNPKPLGARK
jgi:hypothetical protein